MHAWFAARTPWQRRGLAFVAGALAILGHAPFFAVPIFVASLVTLVWLLDVAVARPRKLWSAFSSGWLFGLGYFGIGLHWVSSAFEVDAQTWGAIWGVPVTAALAAVMAIYWGLGCALAMALWTSDMRRIAAFAASVFAAEWARGHLFGGFPWLLPGYIWAPGEPISQLASLVGIYGVSLLTLLVGASPALLADASVALWRRLTPVLTAALALGMAWGWGVQRVAGAPADPPGALPVVRVADSGLSQAEKWRELPDQERRVLHRYLAASGAVEESRASIVIWPEGAIPVVNFFMFENPGFLDEIGRALGDRALIVGFTRIDRQKREFFNSAAVLYWAQGQYRSGPQIYDKHRLVPGSEIMPFEDFVRSLGIPALQQMGGYFTPGPPPSRIVVPGAPEAVILICYEAIFPGLTPHGAERPGWLISLTNDAWFGGGIGPQQHYSMARYRAIEEGLPMARAAAGGVSAIIDSFGREISSTRAREAFAEAQIPPALVETTMARYGNVLVALLLTLVGLARFIPAGRAPGPKR
ncbi:MAG: apolipoprotein N-acyltransferase [Terricaulis sp.]